MNQSERTLDTAKARTRPHRRSRSKLVQFLIICGLLFLVGTLSIQPIVAWAVRAWILPRIEKLIHCKIVPSSISVTPHLFSMDEVDIFPEKTLDLPIPDLHISHLSATTNLFKLLSLEIPIGLIFVDGLSMNFSSETLSPTVIKDGILHLSEKVQRISANESNTPRSKYTMHGPIGLIGTHLTLSTHLPFADAKTKNVTVYLFRNAPGFVELEEGSLSVKKFSPLSWKQIWIPIPPVRGEALTTPLAIYIHRAEIVPWKDIQLTGVDGLLSIQKMTPLTLWVDAQGHYGTMENEPWHVQGSFLPSQSEGKLSIHARRIPLSGLPLSLDNFLIKCNQEAQVGADLSIRYDHLGTNLEGELHIGNLSIYHPMIAKTPIFPIELDIRGRASLGNDGVFVGELDPISFRSVKMSIEAIASLRKPQVNDLAPLGWRNHLKSLFLRIRIPPVACQDVFNALPKALIPKLDGFRLSGQFSTDLSLKVDMDRLFKDRLDDSSTTSTLEALPAKTSDEPYRTKDPVSIVGQVRVSDCKTVAVPTHLSSERLRTEFVYEFESSPGEISERWIGKDYPHFVPFHQISPYLIQSILTTEDSNFMRHRGFITSEFRSALQKNILHGSFRFGASSITMQMIKNVLLDKQKTLSRKLQELFLTWYLEQDSPLPKERILEIYFNVIEFGPGIYGIKDAARHYFGKHPRDLSPREAAWFSSILPSPKKRYIQFCRGMASEHWEKYIDRILGHMHARKRLTDEEYQKAVSERLIFDRYTFSSYEKCRRRISMYLQTQSTEKERTELQKEPGERSMERDEQGHM